MEADRLAQRPHVDPRAGGRGPWLAPRSSTCSLHLSPSSTARTARAAGQRLLSQGPATEVSDRHHGVTGYPSGQSVAGAGSQETAPCPILATGTMASRPEAHPGGRHEPCCRLSGGRRGPEPLGLRRHLAVRSNAATQSEVACAGTPRASRKDTITEGDKGRCQGGPGTDLVLRSVGTKEEPEKRHLDSWRGPRDPGVRDAPGAVLKWGDARHRTMLLLLKTGRMFSSSK